VVLVVVVVVVAVVAVVDDEKAESLRYLAALQFASHITLGDQFVIDMLRRPSPVVAV